jgi:hypothetical protein
MSSNEKGYPMSTTNRIAVVTLGMAISLTTVPMTSAQSNRAAISAPLQTLAVSGAASSTPSLAARGRTVAAVWTASKGGATNVYLAISSDGGATFSAPRRVNDKDGEAGATNEQPPRVVISGSVGAPTLTVLWSKRDPGPQETRRDIIRMSQSTDGGRTFTPARFIHDPAFVGARGWQSLAVGPDGVVRAVWLDGRDADKKIAESSKRTGAIPKGQPPQAIYHGTFSADGRIVESLITADVCFCCKTAVAVGSRGVVYAAWRHIFPGSMRDIAFATSIDGGHQFGPLVRVSEDKWELNGCPEDGPSIAVDQSGTIHIAWATVVHEGEPRKALFYATSRDGKTFSPRARIPAGVATTPGHPQLALTPDGGAAIVWDETVSGLRRVSFTRVSRTGVFRLPEVFSGDESASYPVIARSAAGSLIIGWTSRAATGKSSDPSVIRLRRLAVD